MNINDLQKIWDAQNQSPLYMFDEAMLTTQVIKKKVKIQKIVTYTEYIYLFATFLAGSIIVGKAFFTGNHLVYKYLMATIFYLATVYLFYQRYLRKKEEEIFGNSILEEVEHALSNSAHQVKLSSRMLYVFFPLISSLIILIKWISAGFSIETLGVVLFFGVTYIAARWENSRYAIKTEELYTLKRKLLEEPTINSPR